MSKLKQLFSGVRVWVLVAFIVLSIIAINPHPGASGVAIRQVQKESPAALAGFESPQPGTTPTQRERIVSIDNQPVVSVEQFYDIVEQAPPGAKLLVRTESATRQVSLPNETGNLSAESLIGLSVYPAPKNNLRLGLDLSGGTRVILKPESQLSPEDMDLVLSNIKQRLNVYGLSDIVVRDAKDLSGQDFIVVEIAGVNKDEVAQLLSNQGKFEATIANDTVFRGGNDITYVCRSPDCSGLDRNQGCGTAAEGGYVCRFSFRISLSPEAADRQAAATRDLKVVDQGQGAYLSSPLSLYLDDELVDELQISADLKGRAATDIQISGSGTGPTRQAAVDDALANMKTLQTVLITGSLPVKLDIVKSDSISPVLGSGFIKNAFLLGFLSILAVALVVVTRYRKPIVSIPIMVTMLSEITIILGFAAAVGWNLDLAGIAAIIIAIGSGVDDQIVLIDETLGKSRSRGVRSWKQKIKAAFFIIFASYFTLAAAMVPLFFAGAGLLRGFAITTLVGVTAGVLITRPAFAHFIEVLLKKEE